MRERMGKGLMAGNEHPHPDLPPRRGKGIVALRQIPGPMGANEEPYSITRSTLLMNSKSALVSSKVCTLIAGRGISPDTFC